MEVHTEQKKKQDDWPHTTANLSLYSWVSRTQSYSGDGSWPKTAFNLQHLPDYVCAFFSARVIIFYACLLWQQGSRRLFAPAVATLSHAYTRTEKIEARLKWGKNKETFAC